MARLPDPSQALKNETAERFCAILAEDDSTPLIDAYLVALGGDEGPAERTKGRVVNASKLNSRPDVAARIGHLKEERARLRQAEALKRGESIDVNSATLGELFATCLKTLQDCAIRVEGTDPALASSIRRKISLVAGREIRARPPAPERKAESGIDVEDALFRLLNMEECSCPST